MKRFVLFLLLSISLIAAEKVNPASKAYISDVEGDATVFVPENGTIKDTTKKDVYNAEGLIFETKKKSNQAVVLSNGAGLYIEENSHLEIKKFSQEPFKPNRSDMEVEPSISQTKGYIPHGYVAICTSKIVAGSNMIYQSPHGGVRLFNNKATIDVGDSITTIISVEGEASIQVGPFRTERIKVGEKAIVDGKNITVRKASKEELDTASEKTAIACNAKREVYFDVMKQSENAAEIKAIPIIPIKLPTQFTVSPATIK